MYFIVGVSWCAYVEWYIDSENKQNKNGIKTACSFWFREREQIETRITTIFIFNLNLKFPRINILTNKNI
jgi:hypothetical protein